MQKTEKLELGSEVALHIISIGTILRSIRRSHSFSLANSAQLINFWRSRFVAIRFSVLFCVSFF